MSENQNPYPCFEFVPGTEPHIKSVMSLPILPEPFFPHTKDLQRGMSLGTILGIYMKKDLASTKALSPHQAADCIRQGTFKKDGQNWCWVKFKDHDPELLSFVCIEKGHVEVCVVDEVSKRKSAYSPFGCVLILRGSEKQEEPKEILLPPEQALKQVKSKRR